LSYLKKELTDLTSFAIFENNDARLWLRLNVTIANFLGSYWQQGGLRGATTTDAFFVRCDETVNSEADIMNGRVNIEVGVALEYPAEFVVIKLGQITSNATA
jgi:phage tail sheath protein FI